MVDDSELLEAANAALGSMDDAPVMLWDGRIGKTHGVVMASSDSSTSRILDESNIFSIVRDFPECCEVGSYGGAFGQGYWLIVQVVNDELNESDEGPDELTVGDLHPQFEKIYEIVTGIRDSYPLYDEDDFSRREWEDLIEYLETEVPNGKAEEVASELFEVYSVCNSDDLRQDMLDETLERMGLKKDDDDDE